MAIDITVRLDPKIKKELKRNGEQWAKTMNYATRDMARAGKTIIARQTTSIYNIKNGEVNANSKRFRGGCSMSGGLAEMTWKYTGSMMGPSHFRATPAEYQRNPYTMRATILRGHRVQIGHWQKPWSEGGKHGAQSPSMWMRKVSVPIIRKGGKFQAVKVISVPQMVGSDRHIDETMTLLQERHMEIVMRRLGGLGIV